LEQIFCQEFFAKPMGGMSGIFRKRAFAATFLFQPISFVKNVCSRQDYKNSALRQGSWHAQLLRENWAAAIETNWDSSVAEKNKGRPLFLERPE
jgi:hypothetical protein